MDLNDVLSGLDDKKEKHLAEFATATPEPPTDRMSAYQSAIHFLIHGANGAPKKAAAAPSTLPMSMPQLPQQSFGLPAGTASPIPLKTPMDNFPLLPKPSL